MSDEIKGQSQWTHLTFTDWLECLCRLADNKNWPDGEEMRAMALHVAMHPKVESR